jgi:hypothetical protein
MLSYDGRRFRPVPDGPGQDPSVGTVAHYHQDGGTVWGEFAGGEVRRGSIAGTVDPDGTLRFGYCMVLADGELTLGHCVSRPDRLADGRIRLTERWERYRPTPCSGLSYLEELPEA